jgi:hypothetical protein
MLFHTTLLTALMAATAAFFPTGALAANKSCRQCDCSVTFRSYVRKYDQNEVSSLSRRWVRPLVGGGDFEQFTMGVSPGSVCQGDKCDQ